MRLFCARADASAPSAETGFILTHAHRSPAAPSDGHFDDLLRMASLAETDRLKKVLARMDKLLWVFVFGFIIPVALFEMWISGSIAYGHFAILDAPIHATVHAFHAIGMVCVWSTLFFYLWTIVSRLPGSPTTTSVHARVTPLPFHRTIHLPAPPPSFSLGESCRILFSSVRRCQCLNV